MVSQLVLLHICWWMYVCCDWQPRRRCSARMIVSRTVRCCWMRWRPRARRTWTTNSDNGTRRWNVAPTCWDRWTTTSDAGVSRGPRRPGWSSGRNKPNNSSTTRSSTCSTIRLTSSRTRAASSCRTKSNCRALKPAPAAAAASVTSGNIISSTTRLARPTDVLMHRRTTASRYKLCSTYSSVQNVSTNNKEPIETLCKQSTLQRSAAPYSDCQLTWSYWWIRPTSKFHGAGKVVIFSHAKSSPKLFRPKCKRYYILGAHWHQHRNDKGACPLNITCGMRTEKSQYLTFVLFYINWWRDTGMSVFKPYGAADLCKVLCLHNVSSGSLLFVETFCTLEYVEDSLYLLAAAVRSSNQAPTLSPRQLFHGMSMTLYRAFFLNFRTLSMTLSPFWLLWVLENLMLWNLTLGV